MTGPADLSISLHKSCPRVTFFAFLGVTVFPHLSFLLFFFFQDFIYSFIHLLLESGEGREEEGVKH